MKKTRVTGLDFDPKDKFTKLMTNKELIKYSKNMLAVNKRNSFDKEIRAKDLNNFRNAKTYLSNIGLIEKRKKRK